MIAASIDLGDGLSHIATALRVPVLIAAVVILVLCALECGRFASRMVAALAQSSVRPA